MRTFCGLAWALLLVAGCKPVDQLSTEMQNRVLENADLAAQGLYRSNRFLHAWLSRTDSVTDLIPRNLDDGIDIWNAKDAAADNYPFMVLTAYLTDQDLFEGRLREMLETEKRLTSRVGPLPDTWSFRKKAFRDSAADWHRISFGSSEYIKDGLLPMTELLGDSPWSERLLEIVYALVDRAPVQTPFGNLVSENVELNGELLQVLSRLYWKTGDENLLDHAVVIGDYYLLGDHHPTRDFDSLRLRDHGCEVISGLSELYATVHFSRPEKKEQYRASIHEMYDRIIEVGRTPEGLFYNVVNPKTGEILNHGMADTWGYTLNGFYTVYLLDGTEAYRDITLQALSNLDTFRSFDWEHGSADGYADAVESALNLYNREAIPEVADWIDSEIQVMWDMQQEDGIIEGWHGDGNFARTSLMFSLWKSCGIIARPWREDLRLGAESTEDGLLVALSADSTWSGALYFDYPRATLSMQLPMDWPRINQFPEWFSVDPESDYTIEDILRHQTSTLSGTDLIDGFHTEFSGEVTRFLLVR